MKFTSAGEVVVSVAARSVAPHRHELEFTVRDTGIGIPADQVGRLFQSFTQVDASTTRRFGGTGLGLAICKHLVEIMAGRIWVESELGHGSTFHFTIVVDTEEGSLTPYAPGQQRDLAGKHVLVVDDNQTNRRILRLLVQSFGMVGRAVPSGAEALDLIRHEPRFDAVVLDLHMPEMDGLTLAAEIRQLRDGMTLPLILMMPVGRRELGAECGALFAGFLTKPIKPAELQRALRGALGPTPSGETRERTVRRMDTGLAERIPLHILIAEDNPVNQTVAVRILARLGYRVDVVANGLEALEALRQRPYDVILMDVQMPDMDGFETAHRIRADWPDPERPWVIAMTAHALQGDRERCLDAGMNDYIPKPFQGPDLQAAIERYAQAAAGRSVGQKSPVAVGRVEAGPSRGP